MQIKIFTIPIGAEDTQIEELNHFLRANKIIDVKRELAAIDGRDCWSFCITYLLPNKPIEPEKSRVGSGSKTDYKEILEPDVFERFSELRKVRKLIADSEAVPAYAVFTDAELAEIEKLGKPTQEAMMKIPGIGKKKVEKYGNTIITHVNPINETHRPQTVEKWKAILIDDDVMVVDVENLHLIMMVLKTNSMLFREEDGNIDSDSAVIETKYKKLRTTRISVSIMKKFFVAIFIAFATSVSVININARNSVSQCSMTEMEISAPNDGSYTRTQYSVRVYTDSGHFKGKYSIYLHKGKKYIDFCNTWICIQGKNRFAYCGNWYVIK